MYFATRSNHLTIASMVNMDMRQANTNTPQNQMGYFFTSGHPGTIAGCLQQWLQAATLMIPCMCGGATYGNKRKTQRVDKQFCGCQNKVNSNEKTRCHFLSQIKAAGIGNFLERRKRMGCNRHNHISQGGNTIHMRSFWEWKVLFLFYVTIRKEPLQQA
jgi:hypothetical protein